MGTKEKMEQDILIAQVKASILEEIINRLLSNKEYEELLNMLSETKISFKENENLVRGLDYYNDFTFEIVPNNSQGSQDALGGGGQYDKLSNLLGSKDIAGVGVAFGVDRIMELN